jgi:hypothetical protein
LEQEVLPAQLAAIQTGLLAGLQAYHQTLKLFQLYLPLVVGSLPVPVLVMQLKVDKEALVLGVI